MFCLYVTGEMSELRKALVRKVFKKIDPHKTGMTSIMNIEKLYSAKKHPCVLTGDISLHTIHC